MQPQDEMKTTSLLALIVCSMLGCTTKTSKPLPPTSQHPVVEMHSVKSPPPHTNIVIVFPNTDTNTHLWGLERAYSVNGPWTLVAMGVVNPGMEVTNIDTPTNTQAYYRAYFVWP